MEKQSSQKKTLEIAREFFGKKVSLVFDRPLGSNHPKYGFIYEANYGYVPGVKAADGEDLDAYYLGVTQSLEKAEGICIAILHREDDDDDKLVVVPEGITLNNEEIIRDTYFQEQWFTSRIIRE